MLPTIKSGRLIREAIGTVLGILTFNGPVVLMGMKIIPALLAGCTTNPYTGEREAGKAGVYGGIGAVTWSRPSQRPQ